MNKTVDTASDLARQLVDVLKDKGALFHINGTYVVVMSSLDGLENALSFAKKKRKNVGDA